MSGFAKVLFANLVSMALRWSFIKWALAQLAKKTDNLIDDNAIELVDALYKGDTEKVKQYAEAILEQVGKK